MRCLLLNDFFPVVVTFKLAYMLLDSIRNDFFSDFINCPIFSHFSNFLLKTETKKNVIENSRNSRKKYCIDKSELSNISIRFFGVSFLSKNFSFI